jgi:hypothetical protein
MKIKLNMSMIIAGIISMVLATFILQMITRKRVNGQPVKESFLGFSGHNGILVPDND